MVTRLAEWPRWVRYAALAAVVLLAVGMLVVALFSGPVATTAPSGGPGDLVSYQRIIARMQAGVGYYPAAHEVLVADGYGTRSVFNWRTPAWPMLLAALPSLAWAQGLLGALALVGVLGVYRMMRADGGPVIAAVAAGGVALSLFGIAVPESVVFSEVAAGTLILVSVATYGNGWRMAGLVAGLAALFLRELAAPYVVVCAVLALRDRRWRELALWGVGLVAYAGYFGWHWSMVAAQLGPMDKAYAEGWLQFGGLGFLLKAAGFNGLLSLAPSWLAALLLPLGLFGLIAWPRGGRAALTLAAYVLLFAVVGKPFNGYWGALFTPLMMLGVAWAWVGARDVVRRRAS
ncbi:hypothetical protein [Devosia sp.]|uniref:hypothetical protein n=1 Tax=Devosia sp. TaxID=1871048 RepID=UPI003BAA6B21